MAEVEKLARINSLDWYKMGQTQSIRLPKLHNRATQPSIITNVPNTMAQQTKNNV